MRALLIVNPAATSTTPRVRDVLLHALASDLDLEAVETKDRGHAVELGRLATLDAVDLVITFGGDGTVNETVNGMLDGGPSTAALAVVPGGSTTVRPVPRAAQQPGRGHRPDPRCAARGAVQDHRAGQGGRPVVTFFAGLGLDADVVSAVERRREDGRRSTGRLYVASAVREFFAADRDSPPLTLHRNGSEDVEGLSLAIVQNTSPWTYFGNRAIDPSPEASFDLGLDLFALRGLGADDPAALPPAPVGAQGTARPARRLAA